MFCMPKVEKLQSCKMRTMQPLFGDITMPYLKLVGFTIMEKER